MNNSDPKLKLHLTLELHSPVYSIHRFHPSTNPEVYLRLVKGQHLPWYNITKTTEEVCLVIPKEFTAECKLTSDHQINSGWRCFKVAGPLDFSLIGILSNLSNALAVNSIPLFVVSTFETDYILVKSHVLVAKKVFEDIGHTVKDSYSYTL